MEIVSEKLGTLELDESLIFEFPDGLFGMEGLTRFALIQTEDNGPFGYLQSTDTPQICLLLTNPFLFHREYEFELPESDADKLGSPSPEQVAVWVTVSAPDNPQDATLNLLAPLVLNMERRIGRQVILHNSRFDTRTPMFPKRKEG